MRFVLAFIFLLALFLPEGLMAQNPGGESDPGSEKAALDLLKVFDEATEIATKSKLNADYVPGMVTVLRGKDLQARGIETVWEALALVPGFDIIIVASTKQVSVRGAGNIFLSGNIKFMLNSVPMNNNLFGQALPVFEIPVAQIQRIEVIRGPGSGLHGEYAYVGVVNVITRKEGNQTYARAGSFDTFSGGLLSSYVSPDNDFHASLNLSGTVSDGPSVQTGPDILSGLGLGGISNAPGPTNEAKEHVAAVLDLGYKDFSFTAQLVHLASGVFYGGANALPQPDQKTAFRGTDFTLEARQKIKWHPDLTANIHAGLWQRRLKTNEDYLLFPPGFPGFPNGMVAALRILERRAFGGLDLVWEGWEKHNLLLGWSLAWMQIADSALAANFVPSTGVPIPNVVVWGGSENFLRENIDRIRNSITLQDEYDFTHDLTFTLGLRYDHYDDVGDRLTPRIAGVYRPTDHHILKAQYAQAFRPPTFFELFGQNNSILVGNPNIRPVIIDTFEAGYIYKTERIVGRATFFYSILDRLILAPAGQFQNSGGATQLGMELEWEQEITSSFKLNSNLTWVQTEDRDTGEDVEGSAHILANVGINYRPVQDLMFNVQYRYVGPRHRDPSDSREDLGGYNNVDLTANWYKLLGYKGWTLRGGIRNLFDEDIRYAAPANTYPQDYPRPGIHFWGQLSFEF